MKKFVCSVCGYVYEGEQAPEFCPQCKAPREKFIEKKEGASFACEHEIGVAQGVDKEVYELQRRVHRGWHVSGNEPSGRA